MAGQRSQLKRNPSKPAKTSKANHARPKCNSSPFNLRPRPGFKYEPLDRNEDSFRLLRLYLGNAGDPLRCNLFHAKISSWKGKYIAGSYEWGSRRNPKVIFVNGHQFFITRNLFDFLCACRRHHSKDEAILWIDAISIDQKSILERNHQVRIMAFIYASSSCVYSWLGQASRDSDWTFGAMNDETRVYALHSMANNLWSTLSSLSRQHEWPYTRLEKLIDSFLSNLVKFVSRPYWSRIWILQEVFLAPDLFLLCGRNMVNWYLVPSQLAENPIPATANALKLYSQYEDVFNSTFLELCKMRLRKHQDRHSMPFEFIYLRYSHHKCSVKHDRVFALLGMRGLSNMRPNDPLIDYTLSKVELILQVLHRFEVSNPVHFVLSALSALEVYPSEIRRSFRAKQSFVSTKLTGLSNLDKWPPSRRTVLPSLKGHGLYDCSWSNASHLRSPCLYVESEGSPTIADAKSRFGLEEAFIFRNLDRFNGIHPEQARIVGITLTGRLRYEDLQEETENLITYLERGADVVMKTRIRTVSIPPNPDHFPNYVSVEIETEFNSIIALACILGVMEYQRHVRFGAYYQKNAQQILNILT